jgi:hypothetical protein
VKITLIRKVAQQVKVEAPHKEIYAAMKAHGILKLNYPYLENET